MYGVYFILCKVLVGHLHEDLVEDPGFGTHVNSTLSIKLVWSTLTRLFSVAAGSPHSLLSTSFRIGKSAQPCLYGV